MYSLYSDDDSHSVIGGQQIHLIKEVFFHQHVFTKIKRKPVIAMWSTDGRDK